MQEIRNRAEDRCLRRRVVGLLVGCGADEHEAGPVVDGKAGDLHTVIVRGTLDDMRAVTYGLDCGPMGGQDSPPAERAAALAASGPARDAGEVLNDAGLAALEGGLLDVAGELFEQVAAAFATTGDEMEASAAEANLALLAMRVGALDQAEQRYLRSLELLGRAAERTSRDSRRLELQEANIRVNLGVLYRRSHDWTRQPSSTRGPSRSIGHTVGTTMSSTSRSTWQSSTTEPGRLGRARRRLTAARKRLVAGRDDRARARAATTLAAVAGQQARFAEAMLLLQEAHATYSALALPRELADVLTNQGYVLMHLGDLTGARHHLQQAEYLFGRIGMHLDRARVLGGLGSLELRLGNTRDAVERFVVALEVYDARGLHREAAGMLVNLGWRT